MATSQSHASKNHDNSLRFRLGRDEPSRAAVSTSLAKLPGFAAERAMCAPRRQLLLEGDDTVQTIDHLVSLRFAIDTHERTGAKKKLLQGGDGGSDRRAELFAELFVKERHSV
ncbi:uncharacterized protein SPSC_04607 [Sporisorium scitamineum]|uniref:Uncharacterized protein n=1 Tax=Sporisorium scitamineum TaxID=49012 RepID=A0A0F7S134_9BASI|nr:hypothetical protein [Sporisorium scitamineum]CDU24774.1 uncharacterized protein SPSC_04607 [Sporisorium scitamineum]